MSPACGTIVWGFWSHSESLTILQSELNNCVHVFMLTSLTKTRTSRRPALPERQCHTHLPHTSLTAVVRGLPHDFALAISQHPPIRTQEERTRSTLVTHTLH